jgi:hypothetical protein
MIEPSRQLHIAFGPAVQELLKQVVSNPQFQALAN